MTGVQTAFSSESGRTYQLERLIGKGGFGEVYLATPTPRDGDDIYQVGLIAAMVLRGQGSHLPLPRRPANVLFVAKSLFG